MCGRCRGARWRSRMIGEMMHVDHDAFDAGIGQAVEQIVDQRLAADFDQRLRDMSVIGPHARAQAGRQDDRAVRRHGVPRASLPPISLIITLLVAAGWRHTRP